MVSAVIPTPVSVSCNSTYRPGVGWNWDEVISKRERLRVFSVHVPPSGMHIEPLDMRIGWA